MERGFMENVQTPGSGHVLGPKPTSAPVLGVVGGLGPLASAYFLALLVRYNSAARDQDHLATIAWNDPSVPDRTEYLLHPEQTASPIAPLQAIIRRLTGLGVCCLAMPCITAHAFYDALQEASSVPLLHAVRETAVALRHGGIRRAGVLATSGTLSSRLLQDEFSVAGIDTLIPAPDRQKALMGLIYQQIKAGRTPDQQLFIDLTEDLYRRGAQTVVIGCTELSWLHGRLRIDPETGVVHSDPGADRVHSGMGVVDALDVLAIRALETCGAAPATSLDALIQSGIGGSGAAWTAASDAEGRA